MNAKVTKYTYGQFAKVNGKRYRVRKRRSNTACRTKCAFYENKSGCKLQVSAHLNRCLLLIPFDAYFEKV